jgi:hypothetical protein
MAAITFFNCFPEDLAEKKHNLGSDQLVVALTNSAPVATNTVLANITEVAYTNLSSRNITTSSSSQTSGTYTLVLNDLTLTASGAVGPFRYAVIYNDTASNDELIGWYDRGESISLAANETLKLDFGANVVSLAVSA